MNKLETITLNLDVTSQEPQQLTNSITSQLKSFEVGNELNFYSMFGKFYPVTTKSAHEGYPTNKTFILKFTVITECDKSQSIKAYNNYNYKTLIPQMTELIIRTIIDPEQKYKEVTYIQPLLDNYIKLNEPHLQKVATQYYNYFHQRYEKDIIYSQILIALLNLHNKGWYLSKSSSAIAIRNEICGYVRQEKKHSQVDSLNEQNYLGVEYIDLFCTDTSAEDNEKELMLDRLEKIKSLISSNEYTIILNEYGNRNVSKFSLNIVKKLKGVLRK